MAIGDVIARGVDPATGLEYQEFEDFSALPSVGAGDFVYVFQSDGTASIIDVANFPTGGAGSDTTAIHVNIANEYLSAPLKGNPVTTDVLLIEDSQDSGNKKRISANDFLAAAGEVNDGLNLAGGQTDIFVTKTGLNLTFNVLSASQFGVTSNVISLAANAVGATELADNSVDTAAIQDNAVSNAKLADMASSTIKGAVSLGDPQDLTATEVRTIINVEDGSTAGDADAVHFSVADEFGGTGTAVIFDPNDRILVEDASNALVKRYITAGSLTSGGGGEINTAASQGSGLAIGLTPNIGNTIPIRSLNTSQFSEAADLISIGTDAITKTEIAPDQVSNTELNNMAADTIKGRLTSVGDPQDLTVAQTVTLLDAMTVATYDPAGYAEQVVTETATQSISGKTVNGVLLKDTGSGVEFLADDGTYKAALSGVQETFTSAAGETGIVAGTFVILDSTTQECRRADNTSAERRTPALRVIAVAGDQVTVEYPQVTLASHTWNLAANGRVALLGDDGLPAATEDPAQAVWYYIRDSAGDSVWADIRSYVPAGTGGIALNDLTDVDLDTTPPQIDWVLTYDGVDTWIPKVAPGGGTVPDVTADDNLYVRGGPTAGSVGWHSTGYITPEMFGADGGADDTAALQAAFLESSTNGLRIHGIAGRTYTTTATLTLNNVGSIWMPDSIIKQADAAELDNVVLLDLGNDDRVNVELIVDGNRTLNTAAVTGVIINKAFRGRRHVITVLNCDVGCLVQGNTEASKIDIHGYLNGTTCHYLAGVTTPNENMITVYTKEQDTALDVESGTNQITGRIDVFAEQTNNECIKVTGGADVVLGGYIRGCSANAVPAVVLNDDGTDSASPKVIFDDMRIIGQSTVGSKGVHIVDASRVHGFVDVENFGEDAVHIERVDSGCSLDMTCADGRLHLGSGTVRATRVATTRRSKFFQGIYFEFSRGCRIACCLHSSANTTFDNLSDNDLLILGYDDRADAITNNSTSSKVIFEPIIDYNNDWAGWNQQDFTSLGIDPSIDSVALANGTGERKFTVTAGRPNFPITDLRDGQYVVYNIYNTGTNDMGTWTANAQAIAGTQPTINTTGAHRVVVQGYDFDNAGDIRGRFI